jgi:hypothetical protein
VRLTEWIDRINQALTGTLRRLAAVWLLPLSFVAGTPAMAQGADSPEVRGALVTARTLGLKDLDQLPQTEIVETRSVGAGPEPETTRPGPRHVRLLTQIEVLAIGP